MAAKSNYEIEFIVKGDGTVTARVEGLMKQFRSLDTVINKVNQDIVANQKTLKGTVAYYDQQIDKISKLRDATANTSQAYKEQTAAIDKLKLAKAELTNSIKQVQMPMEGTLAAFRREIQVLRDEQQQVARNQATWQEYEDRILRVKSKINDLTGATRMSVKPNQDLISNAGLAGATLTEFSRTISDLPYGIQGVANNLGQLSTLFITFVSKSNGFKNAIAGLVTQLTGPLGWILALQAGITALEFFSKSEDKAKRAAKELEEQILNTTTAIKDQNKALQDRANDERRVQILTQASLKAAREFLDEAKKATAEFTEEGFAKAESAMLEISRLLKNAGIENAKLLADETIGIEQRISIGNKLVEQSNKRKQLAEEEKKLFEASAKFTDAENKKSQAAGEYQIKLLEKEQKAQQAIISSAEYQILQLNAGLKEIDDSISILSQGVILNPKGESESAREISTILRDLNEELATLRANQFDAQRLAAERELRDAKENIDELVKAGKITQEEAIKSRLVAEEIYSEKWKQIRTEESDFWLDLTKKDQEDATKERIEASKQQLTNLKQTANTEVLARKSALSISITDKKEYEAQSRAIEKESLLELSKRIQFAILANKVVAAEGIAALEEIQRQILALDVAGKGKEEGLDGFDPKKALDATREIFNAGIEAAQAALDAELAIEEAKTAKLNNELRKRLDNENLSAEQKKQINDQIAKNEEALQKKRDQLAEKAFKLQKTASIANTLISTYEMATKAYKALAGIPIVGPALGTAAATAATVFGLKQVDAISRQQFVPSAIGGRGDSGATSAAAIQAPDFNVVGQSNVSQLASVVQGQLDRPVKTYVVASDVSTAQELERKKISTATI